MEFTREQIEAVVRRVLGACEASDKCGKRCDSSAEIPVGVSNRHIHLTEAHVEALFGKGYKLTPIKELSQPGQ